MGKLLRVRDGMECVKFIASNVACAAVLYEAQRLIHTPFERRNILVSHSGVYTILTAFFHAPWLSFREKLARLTLSLFELRTSHAYETGSGYLRFSGTSAEPPEPLAMLDVSAAVYLLSVGHSIAIIVKLVRSMQRVTRCSIF